ncbi:ribonuclease P protein component [Brevibacterium sp. BRM-1]|uniref:ribonuclease P protein component n=1 Tax=Brevibacterium sp. BRM-1 TaxID=2999062 RepID=UPI0022805B75|nr:ribonuclease P protein component [Brevibacterium sp. BRM-1]WAL39560.1 ribonuclease P protein component [Brevibacterium sp. BRM-1]
MRSADDFRRAFRSGVRAGSRVLVLHAAKADRSHAVRVGFVVSKAVGNAVVRNRVKRRLREIMRARLGALAPGLYVVRALPAAAAADFGALEAALDRVLPEAQRKLAGRAEGR